MVNERKIDYLLKIAETQSITKAAKELYVSQSALSQLIASLEKTYDTKIFEYKGGHLTPTYTGEMILNTFRQQQLLEGKLNRQLEDVRQSRTGQLSIGISSGRAPMFLSIVLPEFQKEFPNIQLTINTRSTDGFENMVSSGYLDLAFVMDQANVPNEFKQDLIYEPLFDYYCLLAAPPTHPIAQIAAKQPDWRLREPVNLNDFQNETFISAIPTERHKKWEENILKPYDFQPKNMIRLSEEAAIFSLVQAGLGFALLQDYVAFSHHYGAFFRLDHDNSKATLCIIYHKNTALTKAAQYFIELVKKHTALGSFSQF